ncbi:MAG: M3 family metallopeptidase [Dysgonamonadaceae bacterium]|jgi:peptidyl-dipeptidase Dcp|nr:M3 family metallopeptidase [Dysgonamonadaceae bacterium]
MKKLFLSLMLLGFLTQSYSHPNETNPLLMEWNTPFGTPPFQLIKEHHYIPAYEVAMKEQNAEIDAIVNNPDAPTFENTIVAYDQTGRLMRRIASVFGGINGAHTTPAMQQVARDLNPILSAHSNAIRFNEALFERIQAVYNQRNELNLDIEEMRLVETFYNDFARNGAALPLAEREKLKSLNEQMSLLTLQLNQNMLAEANAFHLILENEDDLVGLPSNVIAGAASLANSIGEEGKWAFGLARPSWTPFLQFSERRDLREQLFRGHTMRGNNNNDNDNKRLLAELVVLRNEMANILGFDNFAKFFISEQMAETPENVLNFLQQVWEPALARAKRERDDMQAIVNREGGNFQIEPWDWWFYAEKVRQEKYSLSEDEIRPYFTLDNVRNGAFYVANRLWGLTFERRFDIPVYYEGVATFEVFDNDGTSLAILYCDPHPRASKRSGAWCGTYRSGTRDVMPLVTTVGNYTAPVGDNPAMLSWDDATTFFHEFGHALHNFFARGRFNRTSRSVPRDFVELPSQVMESWAGEPEVLKVYAKHFETGEVIPDELIERMLRSQHFNQGFFSTEYLLSALIDMEWHTSANITKDTDANVLEAEVAKRLGAISAITPRHRSTHFSHIFGPGYAAGYYVYWWAGQLDADAFEAFVETGDIFNQELADKLRRYIMGGNGKWEGMELYKKFRGSAPSIEPLLRQRGLK